MLRTSGSHAFVSVVLAVCICAALAAPAAGSFTFAILGDRTGDAQRGIFEQIWKEVAAERPAFAISVGDNIEGLDDRTADQQWRDVRAVWQRYRIPFYLAPGNHDIWSAASERLFRQYAGRPPRYSFDYEQAHFTVLDNSRSDELSAEDLDFLASDLKAHAAAAVKMVFSHRPSWILHAAMRDPNFPLHKLARQYGVQYVIAGHVHQMLRFEVEGVTYISMPSSGGHLRLSKAYQEGWFFGRARVDVSGRDIQFRIEELKPPHGQGRVTKPGDWGMAGLLAK